MKNLHSLDNEKPIQSLIRFAVPALIVGIVKLISHFLENVYYLRGFLSGHSFALSKAEFILFPATLLEGLFGVGVLVVVSLALGKSDKEKAERAAGNALTLASVVSLAYALFVFAGFDFILSYVSINPKAIDAARQYLSVACWGVPFSVAALTMSGAILGEGSPWAAATTLITMLASDFLLSLYFVTYLNWGLQGYSYAELISKVLGAAGALYYFVSRKSLLRIKIIDLKPLIPLSGKLIYYGLPTLAMASALRFMYHFTINILAYNGGCVGSLSNSRIAYIGGTLLLPVVALSGGAMPIFGYYFGAGNLERLRETLKVSIAVATVLCALAAGTMAVFVDQLIGLLPYSSMEIIAESVRGARIYYALLPLLGFQIILASFYQATGRPVISLTLSLLRQAVFLGGAQFFLSSFYGLTGVWIASPVADALGACVAGVFIYFELKRLKKSEA